MGAYAVLEVGLRNALHNCLAEQFGREDWWEVAPLRGGELNAVRTAAAYLDAKKGFGLWSAGHLVAELKTSFWEQLLANRYHASLWQTTLRHAFPAFHGRRGELKERVERLRLLRNRAAHHEPIHERDLLVDHRFTCELASFIGADLLTWISSHSRLPVIVAEREATVGGRRPTRF